jgi:MoaA/NifB/PqqE/SkfB family radical SAM enzyme
LDLFKTLLDDLADMGVMSLTLSGGEPLMYQHFFELGAYARKKGFIIKVKSNAVPLNQRNAERLKAEVDPFIVETSLHGARPQSHDRLTQVPGSFDRLLRNIEILKSRGLRVKVNSTLTRWNENEIADMFALADHMDVPLQFDPEVTPKDDGDLSPLDIAPSKAGIESMVRLSLQRSRAAHVPDRLPITLKPANRPTQKPDRKKHKVCGAGSTNLIVDPFGNVFPCVQFRRNVGNIHDQSIIEIWNDSKELKGIRDLAETALDVALGNGLKAVLHGC